MVELPEVGRYYASVQTVGGGRGLEVFPRLNGICVSDAFSPSYRWYAARRVDAPHVIFQLTLSGRGESTINFDFPLRVSAGRR